jgi:hypothetical protein
MRPMRGPQIPAQTKYLVGFDAAFVGDDRLHLTV